MQCSACHHANRSVARVCAQCGRPLSSAGKGATRHLHIGRDEACEIVLPVDDGRVSRVHARVDVLSNDRFRIVDLQSTNGVYINGNRVQSGEFGFADEVSFGSFPFQTNLLRPFVDAGGARIDSTSRWLSVGREESNDVVLPGSAGQVSRCHARIRAAGQGLIEIEDGSSVNGVYVNDERVQTATVGPADTVSFGSYAVPVQLLFSSVAKATSAAAQRAPEFAAAAPMPRRPAEPIALGRVRGAPRARPVEGALRDGLPFEKRRSAGRVFALAASIAILLGGAGVATYLLLEESGSDSWPESGYGAPAYSPGHGNSPSSNSTYTPASASHSTVSPVSSQTSNNQSGGLANDSIDYARDTINVTSLGVEVITADDPMEMIEIVTSDRAQNAVESFIDSSANMNEHVNEGIQRGLNLADEGLERLGGWLDR